jgi:hypothetical protein
MNPILIALAVSVAVNAALGWAYLKHRDHAAASLATATTERDQARTDAASCSAATKQLQKLAAQRAKAAEPARAAAASTARTLQARADATLSLQPSKPADLCASMQVMGDDWLRGRARP